MYTLERFGTITLPTYRTDYNSSPIPAQISTIETTAGAYDVDGTSRNQQRLPFPLSYSCMVLEDTPVENRVRLDALRAVVGTFAKLYRRADDDGAVHWCYARLGAIQHDRPYTNHNYRHDLTLNFQQMSRWHGASHDTWYLDDGEYFDDGHVFDEVDLTFPLTSTSTVVSIPNEGNYPVSNPIITITAAGTSITSLVFAATGIDFTWTGTLLAGDALVLDVGTMSITNDGTNAYDGLVIGNDHEYDRWLELPAGTTALTVTRTGGSAASTIEIDFYDGWA